MNKVWTDTEKQYVIDNAGLMTDEAGSLALSQLTHREVTREAWRKQRQKLGIKKKAGRGVCELAETKTVPGLNGNVTYRPSVWDKADKLPNVMCYGVPGYVNPELWPERTEAMTQEDVKRLVGASAS